MSTTKNNVIQLFDSKVTSALLNSRNNGGRVACPNWDSFHPQPMYVDGRCIGTLEPRARLEALGYGIQSHSRPDTETRTD